MKLIPNSIKKLFNKLFRRNPAEAAPAATPETAPETVAVATPAAAAGAVKHVPAPPVPPTKLLQDKRRAGLKNSVENGVYTFDLDIGRPTNVQADNQQMVLVKSRGAEFFLMLNGHTPLAGTKLISGAIEEHMKKNYGVDVGKVLFKMKGENFYVNGADEFIGLPAGDTYQMVIVPKDVTWKPPVYVPPPRKAQPESCPILGLPPLPAYLAKKLGQTPKVSPFKPG